ncbi:MAG: hypothetical protein VW987_09295, partial [Alphaproteobacteria bacterium]
REALSSDMAFDELPWDLFARTFEEVTGRTPGMDADLLTLATSPRNFVAVRELPGGPGPAALRQSLAGYAERLAVLKTEVGEIRRRISQADEQRARRVAELIAGEG